MITVNAMGEACPMPVIMTKKAMAQNTGAEQMEVLVDNEVAVQNVTKMALSQGGSVETVKLGENEFKVMIAMEEQEVIDNQLADVDVIRIDGEDEKDDVVDNTVIAITSDLMGNGNDALGKVLMKGFIFAVTQLEQLPKTILFYNGGATLTAEGSDSIEDLKHLAEEGVEILTCGTCLNYYEMSDKLLVGEVTNMYTIVEKLAGASKVIRP